MSLAVGRIGDQYDKRCNVPTQGKGSETVFANILAVGRINDKTVPYEEIVPCPKCCKTHTAPVLDGAKKVFVDGIAMERIGSLALGISGTFPLFKGSQNVFVNS